MFPVSSGIAILALVRLYCFQANRIHSSAFLKCHSQITDALCGSMILVQVQHQHPCGRVV